MRPGVRTRIALILATAWLVQLPLVAAAAAGENEAGSGLPTSGFLVRLAAGPSIEAISCSFDWCRWGDDQTLFGSAVSLSVGHSVAERLFVTLEGTGATSDGRFGAVIDTVSAGASLGYRLPWASLWASAGGQVEAVRFESRQFEGYFSSSGLGTERAYGLRIALGKDWPISDLVALGISCLSSYAWIRTAGDVDDRQHLSVALMVGIVFFPGGGGL
jgi:hypothetical protein